MYLQTKERASLMHRWPTLAGSRQPTKAAILHGHRVHADMKRKPEMTPHWDEMGDPQQSA